MSKLAALLVSLAALFNSLANAETVSDISPAKAQQLISKGAWLIDVRTAEEFNAGHLDGARHIEYQAIATQLPQQLTDKTQPIVLYCRSGRRADIAKQALQQLGYNAVVNAGGYEELASASPAPNK
ncbi:rhodanese-like domain-containing protein [Shewanella sp. C32]|uniref:Rhodanese-like domain-containing protein n=1 Tax=Shewanella electrica TaxID=515560 RepID=A0ABT2FGX3_9GAMM|nr:rhodanese-like domain-containing protein [Shewanella electrica]MCH1923467.1 rhodanese-like domain-containing protein [Shewanella electrica]MCS4555564.1 rhodanese-like domain-containing protein [Shewanella electrica]